MKGAEHLEITASLARRVRVLSEDYLAVPEDLPRLRVQLEAVAARMEDAPDLAGMLDRGETDAIVEVLLEHYYDPLYRRSESSKTYVGTVDNDDVERAAREVVERVLGGA